MSLRAQTPITDIVPDLNNIHKWDKSNGDTWDPFWADDDSLYAFNCDGRGFADFGSQAENLAFNKLGGDSLRQLEGKMINPMAEYGTAGELGADKANWKALGQECIDGIFYAFVSRQTYGAEPEPLLRQTAVNASLIKSTDKGKTWTRTAGENYAHPMWPGARFGAPYFVHFGKNGGQITSDSADQYVYAVSNNGFWDDGDDYIIGRVLRAKLPSLDPGDWTYYTGGDGKKISQWSGDIARAKPILALPGQCGSGPVTYIPALGVYLMIAWYTAERLPTWFDPTEMKYDFYQAEHPWGPWKRVKSVSDRFLAPGKNMYGPSICAKFQQQDGADLKITLFTAGCQFEDAPSGLYKMWEIPVILKTKPIARSIFINDDNGAIRYRGSWHVLHKQRDITYHNDLHFSSLPDNSVEYTFYGTGIAYIAQKDRRYGNADIYLDGKFQKNVSLKLENFPRISQVTLYAVENLPRRNHTLKIVNRSNDLINVDAFKVYQ
jgi:hypothetical protein